MGKFVTNTIGSRYINSQPFDLEKSFQDASPGVPMFVFLSPGVHHDAIAHLPADSRLLMPALFLLPPITRLHAMQAVLLSRAASQQLPAFLPASCQH
jgi:hypothetical protein